MYKKVKDDILDEKIKKDLRRIGQWKRQYLIPFEKDENSKEWYRALKKEELSIENDLNLMWDNIENVIKEKESEKRKKNKRNNIK